MTNNHILSLLGLALRGGRLAVGEEPAALAAKSGQARLLLLAADAADNTRRRAEHLAGEGHCLFLTLPFSKAELGGALGRGSAAIAALTDTGLAAAVTERLAALDPERYGGAAARMDLKLRRAKERKTAPRRDPPSKAPPGPRREERPASRRDRRPPRDGRKPEERPPRWSGGGKPGRPEEGKRPYGGKPGRPEEGKRPYKGRPGPSQGGRSGPPRSEKRDHPPRNRGGGR